MKGVRTIAAGLLLAVLPAAQADHAGDNSARGSSEVVRTQAGTYADQMMSVIRQISETYFRPVSQVELARAAVSGLYQTAHEPIPPALLADLAKAQPNQIPCLLEMARERLGDHEELRDQKAIRASLNLLSTVLDPFSGLPPPDHRSDSRIDTQGVGLEFEWMPPPRERQIGDELVEQPASPKAERPFGPMRVSDVLPGGPAQRADIRPGDVLTHIDDFPIESPDGQHLLERLRLPPEGFEKLRLTFERQGTKQPIRRELEATTFDPETVFGVCRHLDNSWDYMLDRNRHIGYLRLGFIDGTLENPHTAVEMENAIGQLKSEGMRGLIFDLRGCPGGFLEPAKAIAGMFIKSGLIATYTDHSDSKRQGNPGRQQFRIDNGSGILEGIATIVLIDEETRGGGEMVAAVLQDHHVARMAGQRTFGKGSVQKQLNIAEAGGTQIWLTTGTFTRPNGKSLQRLPESRDKDDWGIRPDPGLEYRISRELSQQIKSWMKLQTLRPGDGRDPLPLDDPENDPLREFARRELIKQLK